MRKIFRYDTSGTWFKGNTHIHSTASDGGKTVSELAGIYSKADYDFIFITDHWISSNVSEEQGDTPILLLDGIELDGKDSAGAFFHVVCLGKTIGITKEDGLENAMMKAKDQNAITILAHPYWSGNTLEDGQLAFPNARYAMWKGEWEFLDLRRG
jgi:predicted metal-dependent phosphoesterase TrpH